MADDQALRELLAALADGDEDVVQYLVDGLSADPDEANDILEPFVEEHADAAAAALICTQIVALLGGDAAAGHPEPEPEPEPEPREVTAGWELEAEAGDEEAAAAAARTDRLQALQPAEEEGESQTAVLKTAVRIGGGASAEISQRKTGEMIAGHVKCTHCGFEVETGAFRCLRCGNAAPRAAQATNAAVATVKTGAPDGKLAQRRAAKAAAKAAAGEAKAESAGEGADAEGGLSEKRFMAIFGKELLQVSILHPLFSIEKRHFMFLRE